MIANALEDRIAIVDQETMTRSPAELRLQRHVARLRQCRRCPRVVPPPVSGGAIVSDVGLAPFAVTVYGPPGTEAIVRGILPFLDVNAEVRISDGTRTIMSSKMFIGHDKQPGVIFQDSNLKVTAAENSHFHFEPSSPGYGKYKSYALRFDTADRTIVFTGDTGPSEAISMLAKGADLLVSEVAAPLEEFKQRQIAIGRWQSMTPAQQEASIRHQIEEHISPEQVGEMAARAGVKTVVLTHLPATADPKDEYARFGELVRKHFSGQVLIAKDLLEF
jgi:ribonuclease BN (tRNA processing enzyme)